MKSLFAELGSTYTLGKEGMYYPNLMNDDNDHRPIGKDIFGGSASRPA